MEVVAAAVVAEDGAVDADVVAVEEGEVVDHTTVAAVAVVVVDEEQEVIIVQVESQIRVVAVVVALQVGSQLPQVARVLSPFDI